MTCPHTEQFGVVTHCHVVNIGWLNPPCNICESQWDGGQPPTAKQLTPILVQIIAGVQSAPKAMPIPAKPLTPVQKVRNAAKAFAAFVRSGGKLLDAQTVAARLAVCNGCEHRQRFLRVDTCGICSCALRLKSQLPLEHCPKGKWVGDPVRRPCGTPCGQ